MHAKTTIAVPPDLLRAIDKEAKRRRLSRSAFVTRIFREVVRARRDEEIRQRIDDVVADPKVAKEQIEVAEAFERVGRKFRDEDW